MLTGFGNIATAVAAVKAGALDYLPKPADPDQINAALMQSGDEMPATTSRSNECGSRTLGTYSAGL